MQSERAVTNRPYTSNCACFVGDALLMRPGSSIARWCIICAYMLNKEDDNYGNDYNGKDIGRSCRP